MLTVQLVLATNNSGVTTSLQAIKLPLVAILDHASVMKYDD